VRVCGLNDGGDIGSGCFGVSEVDECGGSEDGIWRDMKSDRKK